MNLCIFNNRSHGIDGFIFRMVCVWCVHGDMVLVVVDNVWYDTTDTAMGEAMGNLRNAKCESAKGYLGYFAKRRAKRSVIGRSGNAYFADYPSLLW